MKVCSKHDGCNKPAVNVEESVAMHSEEETVIISDGKRIYQVERVAGSTSLVISKKPPAKKRDAKADSKEDKSKVKALNQVSLESESVGFRLSFHMSAKVVHDEAERPPMTPYDNPFRDVFIPEEAMRATIKMCDDMQAKLKYLNSAFKPTTFIHCMSCWHAISFPAHTQANYDHYRFCVLMKYEEFMYKSGKHVNCNTCFQPLPLGKTRKFQISASAAAVIP